ncbi:MAG: response regulator [Cellulosilyticaceae bacterium]
MPNVIIVEDDLMVMSINKKFISEIPELTVVACFNNGKDALDYLQENPVDLAILDVYMPLVHGITVLEKIRAKALATDVIIRTYSSLHALPYQ